MGVYECSESMLGGTVYRAYQFIYFRNVGKPCQCLRAYLTGGSPFNL